MAHRRKHQAWREFKRAGQIDGMGLVVVVSDEPAANEITDADFLAADLAEDVDKAQRFHTCNDRAARELDAAARDRGVLP